MRRLSSELSKQASSVEWTLVNVLSPFEKVSLGTRRKGSGACESANCAMRSKISRGMLSMFFDAVGVAPVTAASKLGFVSGDTWVVLLENMVAPSTTGLVFTIGHGG